MSLEYNREPDKEHQTGNEIALKFASEDSTQIIQAIKALGTISTQPAIDFLLQKLIQENPEAFKEVTELTEIVRIQRPDRFITYPSDDCFPELAATINKIVINLARQSIQYLPSLLENDNPNIRESVIQSLGWLHGRLLHVTNGNCLNETSLTILPILQKYVQDKNAQVRSWSVRFLGLFINFIPVEPFLELLKDSSPWVLLETIGALCRSKDERAVDALLNWLSNRRDFRLNLAWSLGNTGSPKIVEPLIKILNDPAEYTGTREGAAHSLGKLGDKRALDPLLSIINNPHDEARAWAAEALGDLKDPVAVEPLIQLLTDQNVAVRRRSCHALLSLQDPRSIPALTKALQDTDYAVQLYAARAMVFIGEPEVIPLLELVAENDEGSPDWEPGDGTLKNAALWAIKNIKERHNLQ